jgi:aminoglycoside phosphotransferase (APT) family kinase protein
VNRHGLRSFEPALAWLETHVLPSGRPDVLCHGDFHPLNVLAEAGVVTGVIDWPNASVGPAAADVATTRVILELGPIGGPGFARPAVDLFRRWATGRYTNAYRRLNPVPMDEVRYYEAMRCFSAMLNVGLIRTQPDRARGGYAWDSPHAIKTMTGRFRAITGVRLRLPPAPHSRA